MDLLKIILILLFINAVIFLKISRNTHKTKITNLFPLLIALESFLFYFYINVKLMLISIPKGPKLFLYTDFRWNKIVMLTPEDACEYKEYIHYPKYNSSYTQIATKDFPSIICLYQSSILREYAKYVHLQNVYCTIFL